MRGGQHEGDHARVSCARVSSTRADHVRVDRVRVSRARVSSVRADRTRASSVTGAHAMRMLNRGWYVSNCTLSSRASSTTPHTNPPHTRARVHPTQVRDTHMHINISVHLPLHANHMHATLEPLHGCMPTICTFHTMCPAFRVVTS